MPYTNFHGYQCSGCHRIIDAVRQPNHYNDCPQLQILRGAHSGRHAPAPGGNAASPDRRIAGPSDRSKSRPPAPAPVPDVRTIRKIDVPNYLEQRKVESASSPSGFHTKWFCLVAGCNSAPAGMKPIYWARHLRTHGYVVTE